MSKVLNFWIIKAMNFIFLKTNFRILPPLNFKEKFNFDFSLKTRRFIFRKNSNKFGKIVFDSSLDSQGTDDFFKLLHTLTEQTNCFIISHKGDALYDKFETVLRFEKHKNFSRLAG